MAPSHGTLSVSGSTIQYTPAPNFAGSDTFTYQAHGIDDDGTSALNSGDVTVQVTVSGPLVVPTPALGQWSMILLGMLLVGFGCFALRRGFA